MQTYPISEREIYTLWRRRNRVRLSDISKYCNYSVPSISKWENGLLDLPMEVIKKYDEYIENFEKGKVRAINE